MIVVLDLDGVILNNKTRYPYVDAVSLLQHLDLQGHHIALASFNEDAVLLLRHFALELYFDTILCSQAMSKAGMLRLIESQYTSTDKSERIVFFDDQENNILDATRNGFEAHKVDPLTGLTLEAVVALGL